MELMSIILVLLFLQGLLGGFDTIYHHELRCALPQNASAARELKIHAIRSILYSMVFAGIAWIAWHGATTLLIWTIIAIEVILTLIDFVEEDRSRLLPASERITHTILAINGGAVFALFALQSYAWWGQPTQIAFVSYGYWSWILSIFAVGVFASGVRDAFASCALQQITASKAATSFTPTESQPIPSFLVTGATGFIGQQVVRHLLAQGYAVTAWVRNPLKAAYLFQGRVECVTQLEQIHAHRTFDIVINLAGERILGARWNAQQKEKLLRSRAGLTDQLVAWLATRPNKPRLLLSGSAIGYYGVQDPQDPHPLTESAPSQAIFMSELCQKWEHSARHAETLGITVIRLRFGMILGRQGALPPLLLPIRLGVGGIMGSGAQNMSWMHIDDVVGVIAWLCHQPMPQERSGVYNMVAPEVLTHREFIQTAAKVLHRPAWFKTPAGLLRTLLGEQATILLDGQRVVPEKLLQEGYRFRYPTLQTALTALIHPNKER